MEKQDRTRQLEQLGLEMHQAWMGRVCSWNPLESIPYALQQDLLPESRSLFNDLLRMNRSWLTLADQWSGLLDSGMPWHWNGMGSATDAPSEFPSQLPESSPGDLFSRWPGQPLTEEKSKAVPSPKLSSNKPVHLKSALPGEKRKEQADIPLPKAEKRPLKFAETTESKENQVAAIPNKQIPDQPEEKRKHGTVKPADSPEKGNATLHEERKSMDQLREEPQVTFRRLDDFAAMFRPGKDQNQGSIPQLNPEAPENQTTAPTVPTTPPHQRQNSAPLHSVENSAEKHSALPLTPDRERKATPRKQNSPQSLAEEPAFQSIDNHKDRSKDESANLLRHPVFASGPEPTDSPADNGKAASAPGVPAWDQLQKEWNRMGKSPEIQQQKGKTAPQIPAKPQQRNATETAATRIVANPKVESAGLKPVSSRYDVESRPGPEFPSRDRTPADREAQVENVMDQLLDQLQRDFKRYYGG